MPTSVPGATSARPKPCATACGNAKKYETSGTEKTAPPTLKMPEIKPPNAPIPNANGQGRARRAGASLSLRTDAQGEDREREAQRRTRNVRRDMRADEGEGQRRGRQREADAPIHLRLLRVAPQSDRYG